MASSTRSAAAADLPAAFQLELQTLRREFGFPGATAAYVLPDGTTSVAVTGLADVESGRPMTAQSRMLAASIGKTWIGALAVAMHAEGVLDLDAPVSRWLGNRPWFPRLPNHATITLRHLLTHSAGLSDHVHAAHFTADLRCRWREKENPFPPEALVDYILDVPPLFEAGHGWAYTDTGYILIGLIIEAATGKPCFDQISARFLIPLGLTMTSPSNGRELPGLASGYMTTNNVFGFPPKTTDADGALVWHPGLEWAGGGWVSNSRDLARWGAALFAGKAMECEYLIDLLKAVPISPDTTDVQYGAGVGIYRTGAFGPVYGHGGWIPGYSSSLRYYPNHGVTIAFQINTDIGIVDDTTPVVSKMEARLAKIVLSANNAMHPDDTSTALHSNR